MTETDSKGGVALQDYRLVCRTCLASDAEFYKLDAPIIGEEDDEKVNFLECLRYCTHLDDEPQFPIYICTECAAALQVAYNFIRNALEAHEILRQKLCATTQKQQQRRNNGTMEREDTLGIAEGEQKGSANFNQTTQKKMRFRCKICNEKVETKKCLKEHVKLHLDIISYCCQLCDFETKKRGFLDDHYTIMHGVQPTREQLKPKTNMSKGATGQSSHAAEQAHSEKGDNTEQQPIADHPPIETVSNSQTPIGTELRLDFGNEFNVPANELSVGNEFIVMSDGTVEEVMGNGVVIEYIDAAASGITLENGLVLKDVVQMASPIESQYLHSMDVDDIIIEENDMAAATTTTNSSTVSVTQMPDTIQTPVYTSTLTNIEDELPPPSIISVDTLSSKRVKCKICASNFPTQDQLKTHMLTHNEIPHFFCDQCTFYTFFKIDLTQHYKTKHKLQPTMKQLQPKNKVKSIETQGELKHVYNCDMCLFETRVKAQLRRHYLSKHQIEATEVQLRPTIDDSDMIAKPTATLSSRTVSNGPDKSYYPNGINCKKCFKTFYWRSKLKEHYKQHMEEGAAATAERQMLNQNAYDNATRMEHNSYQQVAVTMDNSAEMLSMSTAEIVLDIPVAAQVTATSEPLEHNTIQLGYSCTQIPSDAIPQIVETDTAIDNDIDFDFNDALFEDFGDENENEDYFEDYQDMQMTSDEEDLIEQQQIEGNGDDDGGIPKPFCVHCSRKFYSQYHFENHMFVHRGLAPYRCEMCTNLYNTKRALIRHYKAVHKKTPSRDMIQAKGDKVTVDRMPIEHLQLEEQKALTLMCAKCPYESNEMQNLEIHLSTIHGITDENYILQKLPYECPRCIRSYATKLRLMRHLERSHSVATIIQPHQNADSATPTTTNIVVNSSAYANANATITLPSAVATNNAKCGKRVNQNANHHNDKNTSENVKRKPPTAIVDEDLRENEEGDDEAVGNDDLKMADITHKSKRIKDIRSIVKPKIIGRQKYTPKHDNSIPQNPQNRTGYECDICQCTYKSVELLKYHMKRHTSRKYQCNKCPKTYINRSELKNHQRLHTGEMPHACDQCSKKFRYSHHLKRHRDVAHLGKRHRCEVEGCERIFTTQAQLKIHMWNHTGNFPYKCKYCERAFKKREALRQHARKMHQCLLTEEEIAEIYRQNVGYTNPHDFTVSLSNGQMLRRSDLEASQALHEGKADKSWSPSADVEDFVREEECVLEIDTNAEQSLPTYMLNDIDNENLGHY